MYLNPLPDEVCCRLCRYDIPRMFGIEGLQPLKIHLDEGK